MATPGLLRASRPWEDVTLARVMGPDPQGGPGPSIAACRLALRAVVALALASSLLSVLHLAAAPPFTPPDEMAHVAYALAVGDGDLPHLREFPDTSRIPHMRENISQFASTHPPLIYAVLAVPLRLGEAVGLPLAGLYAARLLIVASAGLGYVLFGLLGLALLPSRPSVAVIATAIAALTPYHVHLAGVVYNDAPVFALITGQLLVAVIALRRGLTTRRLILLTALSAAAANARAVGVATALLCAGAAGLAVLLHDRRGWAPRLVRGVVAGAVVGLVAGASSAWFYLLNHWRYGSFTGAAELMDIHGLEDRGLSTTTILFERPFFWRSIHSQLWGKVETYTPGHAYLPREVMIVGRWMVAGAAFAFLAWAVWRIVQGAWRQPLGAGAAWLLVAVWFAALAFAMADFVHGGGGPHARYLWPGLIVVHMCLALGLAALPGGRRGIPALGFLAYVLVANANNLMIFLFLPDVPGPALGLRALAHTTPGLAIGVLGVAGAAVVALLAVGGWAVWRLPRSEPTAAVMPFEDNAAVVTLATRTPQLVRVDLRDVAIATVVLAAAFGLFNHVYALGLPLALVPFVAAGVSLASAAVAGRRRLPGGQIERGR